MADMEGVHLKEEALRAKRWSLEPWVHSRVFLTPERCFISLRPQIRRGENLRLLNTRPN